MVFQGKEMSYAMVPIKSRRREFESISAANAAECSTIELIHSLIIFAKMNLLLYSP